MNSCVLFALFWEGTATVTTYDDIDEGIFEVGQKFFFVKSVASFPFCHPFNSSLQQN